MKFLAVFLFVTVTSAEISQQRQISLAVVNKLREALPDFISSHDSINQHVSEAKQNASDILESFLLNVFETKMNKLQSILKLEADTLAFGAKIDKWCWESNIPMLEGIMGWIGTDFSKCIVLLDKSAVQIIGNAYSAFHNDEKTINENYSLFDAFNKRNIISNPQSISNVISKTIADLRDTIPKYGGVLTIFEQRLNGTLQVYEDCLTKRLNTRTLQILAMRKEAMRCVEEQKEAAPPVIIT